MIRRMTLALALLGAGCAPPPLAAPTATTPVEVHEMPEPEPAAPVVKVDTGTEAIGLVELDASAVVVADYPPALLLSDAPATLPPSMGPGLRHTPAKLMKGGALGFGRVEVPDKKLVRMHIGTVRMHGVASKQSFLYCGEDIAMWRAHGGKSRPSKPRPLSSVTKLRIPIPGSAFNPKMRHPGITPARWEVLTTDSKGDVVLTITDAWFDHRSCRASVQRVTHIHPQPVLDGLAFVFKGSCADCREPESLTLVMPPFIGANRRQRQISSGAFVMARFPLRPHRSSRVAGLVERAPMRNWQRSLHGAVAPVEAFPKTVLSAELLWSSRTGGHRLRLFGAQTTR